MIATLSLLERFRRSAQAAARIACAVVSVLGLLLSSTAYAYAPTKARIQMSPKAYAKANLSLHEFQCLNKLYTKESNWRANAVNGSHYGIPQGNSLWLKGKSPIIQVKWGIKYNRARYGTMCKAWDHWLARGWH